MQSISALISLLALPLIAKTSHARPDMGDYWHVMNGEAMPMIQDLMDTRDSVNYALSNKKSETKVSEDIVHEKLTVGESVPTPDATIYPGDYYLEGKNSYVDESDPIPDTTIAW